MDTKDTNPKDSVGVKKWRQFCTIPFGPICAIGVAMLEGARKYGRHNYRVAGVRASVYIDAAIGHLIQWWEGEDVDKDSELNHITKAAASLVVLLDGMMNENYVDDRPPKSSLNRIRTDLQDTVNKIFEKYPDAKAPFLCEQEHDYCIGKISGTLFVIQEDKTLKVVTPNPLCHKVDDIVYPVDWTYYLPCDKEGNAL